MKSFVFVLSVFLICSLVCASQQLPKEITIQVRLDQPSGKLAPFWNYFGYDEPNYSETANGRKLLSELGSLASTPTYVRVHNLLTSGDGTGSLKWGSTNVYSEDANGNAVYSWTVLDRIFDAFHATGVKPLVELGFMPEALSTHPVPYRHNFPEGTLFTGWAYPPKDYEKWGKLIFEVVRHLRQRYGDDEVRTWLWEVWNEPDIEYWKGTPEEYFKLYDYSVEALTRALPEARIGGPDTTGPASKHGQEFLRGFLEHCSRGKNYATGKIGTRVDFIAFHPKGNVTLVDGRPQMGISTHLKNVEEGFKIVTSFSEYRKLPIVLGESDPEGCAACSIKMRPQNAYRNGPLYAAYTVESFKGITDLAARYGVDVLGVVTWAFEFEKQPYFEGFRTLATNGIDKPVLNAFRMMGLLGSQSLKVTSSGAIAIEEIVNKGVRERPDVDAIATGSSNEVDVLVWNYHDDDVVASAQPIEVLVTGLPKQVKRGLVEHYRLDDAHSNSFTAWKEMGSPASPTPAQYQQLENASQLELLGPPSWEAIEAGTARITFNLPRQGLSMIRIKWN